MHTSCAGLKAVPEGDWLCGSCLDVLDARKKSLKANSTKDKDGQVVRSLVAKLPDLPKLDANTLDIATTAMVRFKEEMTTRKQMALERLKDNQRVLKEASQERIANLSAEIQTATVTLSNEQRNHNQAKSVIFARHQIVSWSIREYGRSYIKYRRADNSTGTVYKERQWRYGQYQDTRCPDWNR